MILALDGRAAEDDDMDASLQEEVLLDENAQAQKHSFYMVRGFEVRTFRLRTPIDCCGGPQRWSTAMALHLLPHRHTWQHVR